MIKLDGNKTTSSKLKIEKMLLFSVFGCKFKLPKSVVNTHTCLRNQNLKTNEIMIKNKSSICSQLRAGHSIFLNSKHTYYIVENVSR